MAIKVDADYTSQACPRCGHTCPENRPEKGLLFSCTNCHYRLHADQVGARNVRMRTLLTRQDWARTGTLEVAPDGSDREAKAARLNRYAELRWSPDTSPRLLDLILTYIFQMDSVKRPLKPVTMEACFTTPAIPIRSTNGPKKMWGRISLLDVG